MKRRQESEPTLVSVIFFSFLLRLSEVKCHWSKTGKGDIISAEVRLNPWGVSNLAHIKKQSKSSTFGQRKS